MKAGRPVVVIKIGSASLVADDGRLDDAFLAQLAAQVAMVQASVRQAVVVSSGAVACGLGILGLRPPAPAAVGERQALAAIGQADLIHRWQLALAAHGCIGAQLLLSADDFADRRRYLNLTASLRALFAHNVVPIINENDVVSVAELTLGDNDRLSALVASQLEAERLILLTDIDGLYDADPRTTPSAKRISQVERIDRKLLARTGGSGRLGTGGMRSKLEAARIAARAGVPTVIARAREPRILARLLADEDVGTRISAGEAKAPGSRRRWLAFARPCQGAVHLDAGAERALTEGGRSILAVGICGIEASFERGDTVSICNASGEELARGLINLSAAELRQVQGLRQEAAAERLGYPLPKTVIHRDNIVLQEPPSA